MMIISDVSTFESKVLFDQKCHSLLTGLEPILQKWILGLRANLSVMRNQAAKEIFYSLNEHHLQNLQTYKIIVNKLDTKLSINQQCSIQNCHKILPSCKFYNNFTISRVGNEIYLSAWR